MAFLEYSRKFQNILPIIKAPHLNQLNKMNQEITIGIDLGTTYSCAAVWRNNHIEIIPNDQGGRTTPSYVAFTQSERIIGEAAKNQVARNPRNTVFDSKRLIGRHFSDPVIQKDMRMWPFKLVPSEEGKIQIQIQYQNETHNFYPEEVSAMVLSKMKEISESYLGRQVKNAVITVPAYFNDAQRKATRDAGIIAGLNVRRIINEPTAAAIAYGIDNLRGEHNALIVDIGGGTYDVSLLSIDRGVIEVISTAGNSHLGGEDFDSRMVEFCAQDFFNKTGVEIWSNPRALRRLRTACERAKRTLSSTTQAAIEIECLADSQDYYTTMSRAKFEELNLDYFRAVTGPIQIVLQDAELNKRDIHEIVLVGGSTRIPKIQQIISEFFGGKELFRSINPDKAVAVGAAIQGAILQGEENERLRNMVLLDVLPLSLGIETTGGAMTKILPRNTTYPVKKTQVFTTFSDNATSVTILVYEGERPLTKNCNFLGSFTIEGIPPLPRGIPQIEVTFEVDANGILNVHAVDKVTLKVNQIRIQRDRSCFTHADIERLCREAEFFSRQDQKMKETLEAKNSLESKIGDVRFYAEKISIDQEEKVRLNEVLASAARWFEEHPKATTQEIQSELARFEEQNHEILERMKIRSKSDLPKLI